MPPIFAKFIKRASLFGWTPNSIWIRHNIVSVLATHTVDLTQCHVMCDTSVEWAPRSRCVLLMCSSDRSSPALVLFKPSFWYFTFTCVLCKSPSSIFYSIFSTFSLRICIITAVNITVIYPCVCSYNNVLYDWQHEPALHISLFRGLPGDLVQRIPLTFLPVSPWEPNFLSSLRAIFWNSTMDYKCTFKMKQCHNSLSWESVHFRVN